MGKLVGATLLVPIGRKERAYRGSAVSIRASSRRLLQKAKKPQRFPQTRGERAVGFKARKRVQVQGTAHLGQDSMNRRRTVPAIIAQEAGHYFVQDSLGVLNPFWLANIRYVD